MTTTGDFIDGSGGHWGAGVRSVYRRALLAGAAAAMALSGCVSHEPETVSGPTGPDSTPTFIDAAARHIALSDGVSCAIVGGRMRCWGDQPALAFATGRDACGRLTSPCATSPVVADSGLTFRSIAAGAAHVCGFTADGRTYCWGANGAGQLGVGAPAPADTYLPAAPAMVGASASISAGNASTCAVSPTGRISCWGLSVTGVDARTGRDRSPLPERFSADSLAVDVAVGGYTACFLTRTGQLFCWGSDIRGSLGTTLPLTTCVIGFPGLGPAQPCTEVPRPIGGPLRFTQMSTSLDHTCAVSVDHVMYCWGTGYARFPSPVPGGGDIRRVAAGVGIDCGLDGDGRMLCLGSNEFGVFGRGIVRDSSASLAPVSAPGPFTDLALDRPTSGHTHRACGLTTTDQLWCWGLDLDGQLGIGPDSGCVDPSSCVHPRPVLAWPQVGATPANELDGHTGLVLLAPRR